MPHTSLKFALAAVFGMALLLCLCVLLFRDTPNATSIATVIGFLIAALFATVYLEFFSEVTLGPLKAKLRNLHQRIDDQERVINAITTALEFGVTTGYEYDKLEGLERDGPFRCRHHGDLLSEMKRLFDRGFVKETRPGTGPQIDNYRGLDQEFDLKNHFLLTDTGKKYLECRREWQKYVKHGDVSPKSPSDA